MELKFDSGFPVIGEYLSQFDSNILQLLGIPGRILVPSVTQLLGQNDSTFFSVGTLPPFSKSCMCRFVTKGDRKHETRVEFADSVSKILDLFLDFSLSCLRQSIN